MIDYMNAALTYTVNGKYVGPTGVLRGQFIPSAARPGWMLIQTPDGRHASMLPSGAFQASSTNDGPYEQCLPKGNIAVFQPRGETEDQWVGFVTL